MSDFTKIYIDGKWCVPSNGEKIAVIDPATGRQLGYVADGSAVDVDAAVRSARHAFNGEWCSFTAKDRARILFDFAHCVSDNLDELAGLESKNTGKPLAQAENDIRAVADYFRFYAGGADKLHGDVIAAGFDATAYTIREPLGVIASIVPWNYPAQIFARSVSPALATGNSIVLKPAPEACFSILRLTELLSDVGLPPGVLNVVPGYGNIAGAALVSHPDIDHISFTGSTSTGTRIQKSAAENNVPATMELGGKSPQIVFADANQELAAKTIADVCIQHAGQTCSAGTRVLIQSDIWDDFVAALSTHFNAAVAGPNSEPYSCGPVMKLNQQQTILTRLEAAEVRGLNILAKGKVADEADPDGYYVPPTLIGPVASDDPLAQTELFGPVLVAIPFQTDQEAISIANATDYGLVAGIWTRDGTRQLRLARAIRSGQIFINNYGAAGGVELPFGGVKRSGYGREKGFEALFSFTLLKTIAISHASKA